MIDLQERMDPITSTSSPMFEQMGWMALENVQDSYMTSRAEANRYVTEGLHEPAVGDMRIKWEIVTN
jgi:hypothetical protein